MREVVLMAHNLRSAHNIGSLFRTCDGLGVSTLYLSGYSPYPPSPKDSRLPHVAAKAGRQIAKTALGAEKTVAWEHAGNIHELIGQLKEAGFQVVALEQTTNSSALAKFKPGAKIALLVGNEVDGLEAEVTASCDASVEITMHGTKESFNVAVAAAIALYHLRFVA